MEKKQILPSCLALMLTQQTQHICIKLIQRRPNVFDVGPTLYKVIQMFCVYWEPMRSGLTSDYTNCSYLCDCLPDSYVGFLEAILNASPAKSTCSRSRGHQHSPFPAVFKKHAYHGTSKLKMSGRMIRLKDQLCFETVECHSS